VGNFYTNMTLKRVQVVPTRNPHQERASGYPGTDIS
jgi:hypothetical protein